MNESNDNSNSEGIPERKKKRKKHKKKKTITLDEFLNMNKDVFGEGLGDVQGIEEVPTQVVAKQLKPRKPSRIKITPTAEIEKLKKQGIVVKKQLNHSNQFQGMKVVHSRPINLQNVRPNTTNPTVQEPKSNLSSPNDVLAKLQNSQLKIVKKSAQNSCSEVPEETEAKAEKINSLITSDLEDMENVQVTNKEKEQIMDNIAHKEKDNINYKVQMPLKNTAELNPQSPGYKNLNKLADDCKQWTEEERKSPVLSNNKSSEDNFMVSEDYKGTPKLDKPRINSANTLNALKNLSQHITIKPMLSPNSALNQQKTNLDRYNIDCQSSDVDEDHLEDEIETTDNKVIESKQSNADKKSLNALKHLSHLTVKSVNQSKNVLPVLSKNDLSGDHNSAEESDIEKCINSSEIPKHTDIKDIESKQSNSDKKSLNALKHLSHLIVKSVNQPKSTSPVSGNNNLPDDNNSEDEPDIEKYINSSEIPKPQRVTDITKQSNVYDQQPSKSLDTMKHISQHVTIKSLKQTPKSVKIATEKGDYESDNDNHADDDGPYLETNAQNGENMFGNKNLNIKLQSSVAVKSLRSPVMKSQSPNNSPKSINRFVDNVNFKSDKELPVNIDAVAKQTCTNLLKQLPNITAKPLSSIKNAQPQITVNTSKQAMSMQKANIVHKTEVIKEEIEIFDIDDSDEEEMKKQSTSKNETQTKPITNSSCKIGHNITNQKLDELRNLDKNITIKSASQLKTTVTESSENFEDDEADQEYFSDDENVNVQMPVQKTTSLNNTLRNLGKHITVKSSSPKTSVRFRNISTKIEDIRPEIEEYDSESEIDSQVRITEINHESDNDKIQNHLPTASKNVPVPEIEEYDSDHEIVKDNNEDVDGEISTSILGKRFPEVSKKPDCLSNLKNITIKSLKDVNFDDDEENDEESETLDSIHEARPNIPKFGKQMPVKPFKQMKTDSKAKTDTPVNKNMNQQVVARSSDQFTNKKKVSTSSDQVNTVNKEVTVQTFQTKTVIQEITTTVTKTIRTLNQTVKQEVQNTSQNTSIRPQRFQGITPNQNIHKFQGTQVRQAMPTMRPRMRNPTPANRPVVGSFVRSPNQGIPVRGSVTTSNQLVPFRPPTATSNQLVPVRPGVTVRGNSPRLPVIRKPGPSTSSPQRPIFGKPLKISPMAMTSNKRPAGEETAGPFSCFKKPKDSPIPSFDDSEGHVHFASSSQTSRSNFSNTTKMVKGNSLVTSSQMSSEVSSSVQQISNLSNMSGIKVVKTSQAKQTTHVEEKSEVSSSKRSTLEAIERLQKQGLLVKKPRVEEEDTDQDHFDSGGDDDDDCYDNT